MQENGGLTLAELAQELGVNPSSLRVRLWESSIEPDGKVKVGRYHRGTFSAGLVAMIKTQFQARPLHAKRGRPAKIDP